MAFRSVASAGLHRDPSGSRVPALLCELGEIAAAGGDIRSRLFR